MNPEQQPDNGDSPVQTKTMWVLGLTFILPIIITLIAVSIMM